MSSQDFGIKSAQAIRVPATANLLIDSADRYEYSNNTTNPFNFQIYRPQNLINGFFTRVGVSEVVMEWCEPNIPSTNNFVGIDVSGLGVKQVTIPGGFYTTAGLLDTLVSEVNSEYYSSFNSTVLSVVGGPETPVYLDCSGYYANFASTRIANALGIYQPPVPRILGYKQSYQINCPDLRPCRYIDIICEDLTKVQRVKDSSTAPTQHDVLTRFYFDEDSQETYDSLGFPILMGYKPFCRRKLYNPPKQIRWEQNIPVGSLAFTAYARSAIGSAPGGYPYAQLSTSTDTNWDMTLQLSEN